MSAGAKGGLSRIELILQLPPLNLIVVGALAAADAGETDTASNKKPMTLKVSNTAKNNFFIDFPSRFSMSRYDVRT
jgi:hypothetical protein